VGLEMSDAPGRIWLDNVEDDVTEYVRKDIHDAVVAENNVLRDEVGRLQTKAMGAVDAARDAEFNFFATLARVKGLEAKLLKEITKDDFEYLYDEHVIQKGGR